MRILLDACVSARLATLLSNVGHEVLHAVSLAQGISDIDLVSLALEDQRVIISHDKDFSRIAYQSTAHFGGILIIPPDNPEVMYSICLAVLEKHQSELLSGYVLIANQNKLRKILPFNKMNGK